MNYCLTVINIIFNDYIFFEILITQSVISIKKKSTSFHEKCTCFENNVHFTMKSCVLKLQSTYSSPFEVSECWEGVGVGGVN